MKEKYYSLTEEQIDHIIQLVIDNTECASPICMSHVSNNYLGTKMEIISYLRGD